METVQIVLDKSLLQATDRAARRLKLNRSALVREALREHLKMLEVRTSEERDRGVMRGSSKPAMNLPSGRRRPRGRRNSPRRRPPLPLCFA